MRTFIARFATFFLIFLSISVAQAKPRDAEWLDLRMRELEAARKIENITEKIEVLADRLRIAGDPPKDNFQQIFYEAVQRELLAIPEHAAYFKDKLERVRLKVKNSNGDSDEQENDILEYKDVQGEFGILGSIPSPQSVAVLGSFIEDSEGRDGLKVNGKINTGQDGFDLNCLIAMRQLNRIGIEKPPVDLSKPVYKEIALEYVDKWKDWWEEVKSGKRTYRFIGSNIEYGPDGPASPETIKRVERNMRRDSERSSGQRKPAAGSEGGSPAAVLAKPVSIAGILAACALVAGAAWYFLRGRKVA